MQGHASHEQYGIRTDPSKSCDLRNDQPALLSLGMFFLILLFAFGTSSARGADQGVAPEAQSRYKGCENLAVDAVYVTYLKERGLSRGEARDGLSGQLDRPSREQLEALIIEAYSWDDDLREWVASVKQRCLQGSLAAVRLPASTKANALQ